jgi:hypothetical protein
MVSIVFDILMWSVLIILSLYEDTFCRRGLERVHRDIQMVEAQMRHLTDNMEKFSEYQLDALWRRASEEVDREIVRARERNRR